jgi:DNA-binding NtrC family response regulator
MSELRPLVVVADDDPHLRDLIEHHVTEWGYRCAGTADAEALQALIAQEVPAVILLDIGLGDTDGITLVEPLTRQLPAVPIIMITANATVQAAVDSLKQGAYDFLCKPLDFDRLHIEIDKAIRHHRLTRQVAAIQQAAHRSDFHGMVGRSEAMRRTYRLIETVGPTDASVLILGETGTGKELCARAIHECSERSGGPFVAVNAPAIPHELIESALFGHEKGAFTGAHQRHVGHCEQADGGTLFLDEIAEMDYNVQAKLLRFLQDHVVQPVGMKHGRTVDVRVVAATNRDPQIMIDDHKLREDFFYRLSVVTVPLAPLREREGDIPLLVRHFLSLAATRYNRSMKTVAPEARLRLERYAWPGNVRQMENLISQLVITQEGDVLTAEMLPDYLTADESAIVSPEPASGRKIPSMAEMEHHLIVAALETTRGVVPQAAELLELSPATLYRKIKKYGLSRTYAAPEAPETKGVDEG